MENIYKILADSPLFRGISAAQIKDVLSADDISITEYKKGDLVARRDTAYSGLMIILQGRAGGIFTSPSGRETKVDAIEAPQPIAPAFLFGGYNRLPVDIVAETDLQVMTLHRGYLFELMQDNTLILSNFIDIISNRAGVWQKKIYALSRKSLKEKFASYLLDHSSPEDPLVEIPDIREAAQFFAATRSSLESVVRALEKQRVISSCSGNIEVLNRQALKDILE